MSGDRSRTAESPHSSSPGAFDIGHGDKPTGFLGGQKHSAAKSALPAPKEVHEPQNVRRDISVLTKGNQATANPAKVDKSVRSYMPTMAKQTLSERMPDFLVRSSPARQSEDPEELSTVPTTSQALVAADGDPFVAVSNYVSTTRKQVRSLETQLHESNLSIKQYQADKITFGAVKSYWDERLQKHDLEHAGVAEKNSQLTTQVVILESELHTLQRQMASLEASKSQCDADLATRGNELALKAEELRLLQTQLGGANSDSARLEEKIKQLKKQIETQIATISNLEVNKASLTSQLNQVTSETAERIGDLKASHEQLNSSLKTISLDNESLISARASLQAQFDTKQAALDKVTEELKQANETMSEMREQHNTRIELLRSTAETSQSKLAEKESEIATLSRDNAKDKDTIHDLSVQHDALKKECASLRKGADRLQTDVDRALNQNERLRLDLDRAQFRATATLEETKSYLETNHAAELAALRKERDALQGTRHTLVAEVDALREKLNQSSRPETPGGGARADEATRLREENKKESVRLQQLYKMRLEHETASLQNELKAAHHRIKELQSAAPANNHGQLFAQPLDPLALPPSQARVDTPRRARKHESRGATPHSGTPSSSEFVIAKPARSKTLASSSRDTAGSSSAGVPVAASAGTSRKRGAGAIDELALGASAHSSAVRQAHMKKARLF